MNKYKKKGFTLIELLAVVFIVGVLASVVIISLNNAKENSKVSAAVSLLETVKKAADLYKFDTKLWPQGPGTPSKAGSLDCRGGGTDPINCTSSNDPFKNANGVTSWNGPYFESGIYALAHPWGGAVNYFYKNSDVCSSGPGIVFDDDSPGHDSSDDKGAIPFSAIQKVDDKYDNGVLDSGTIIESTNPPVNPGDPRIRIGEIKYCFPFN